MSKENYGDLVTSRATELAQTLDRCDLKPTVQILLDSYQSMSPREWNRFLQETNKRERNGDGLDLHPVNLNFEHLGRGETKNSQEITRLGRTVISSEDSLYEFFSAMRSSAELRANFTNKPYNRACNK